MLFDILGSDKKMLKLVCLFVCLQGLVTTLHEGEDFGQLALLNDAPRAATIILREDNCHFLRVDKQDFIRILKVRLWFTTSRVCS